MAKIVIRNLTKTYSGGTVVALQDVNLDIASNESLCVLGPSGCGKTTLLRIADCLISRDRGDVLIDGEPVTEPRPDVAVVFQHFGLFPWKRLDENIAYGLELRGKSQQEISAVVERYVTLTGLKGFEKLAINPSVLLMDEPFGALDAQTRELTSEAQLWRHLIIPSALPFIVFGVRLAIGRGLVGMIVAEFYTSVTGLGYMIVRYANAFETAKLFVPIVVVMVLGVGLVWLTKLVDGRLMARSRGGSIKKSLLILAFALLWQWNGPLEAQPNEK